MYSLTCSRLMMSASNDARSLYAELLGRTLTVFSESWQQARASSKIDGGH